LEASSLLAHVEEGYGRYVQLFRHYGTFSTRMMSRSSLPISAQRSRCRCRSGKTV